MAGKITIPSSATAVIPVPPEFRKRDYLYIHTITIEGQKDHAQKLVIKHKPLYPTANDKIVVPLVGSSTFEAWEEFEGASLEAQYDNNFLTLTRSLPEHEYREFFFKKSSLNAYIRDYLLNNESGKRVMALIRRSNEQIQQRLEAADAPPDTKVVMEVCEHIIAKHKIVTVVYDNSSVEEKEMRYYKEGQYMPGAEILIKDMNIRSMLAIVAAIAPMAFTILVGSLTHAIPNAAA